MPFRYSKQSLEDKTMAGLLYCCKVILGPENGDIWIEKNPAPAKNLYIRLMLPKLPIGQQDFRGIAEKGYLYIYSAAIGFVHLPSPPLNPLKEA